VRDNLPVRAAQGDPSCEECARAFIAVNRT